MTNDETLCDSYKKVEPIEFTQTNNRQLAALFDPDFLVSLKPIDWIYENFLAIGMVSALIAKTGVGKSLYATTLAVEVVTGRTIITDKLKKSNVWLVNLEDSKEEVYRRVCACMSKNAISQKEVSRHLFINAGADFSFQIAKSGSKSSVIFDHELMAAITAKIIENRIGLLIIDPFINIHQVDENDNMAIDKIVKELSRISLIAKCAILLVHHTSKNGNRAANIESSRGASSFIAACRVVRVVNGEKNSCISVAEVKSNYSNRKREIKPMRIDNYSVEYENSAFEAGVLDLVDSKRKEYSKSKLDEELILRVVLEAEDNKKNRFDSQANDWIGHEICKALNLDVNSSDSKNDIKTTLNSMVAKNMLEKYRGADSNGKMKYFLRAIKIAN